MTMMMAPMRFDDQKPDSDQPQPEEPVIFEFERFSDLVAWLLDHTQEPTFN